MRTRPASLWCGSLLLLILAQAPRVAQARTRHINPVKTTTFITDLKNVPALREVRAQYSRSGRPPANTLVVVSSLARPELMIEIEAVAVLRDSVRYAE